MARYPLRLCIKQMQDVVVSAKTEKEAIEKAFEILNTGLGGSASTQVE